MGGNVVTVKSACYAGIDPGKNGAVAIMWPSLGKLLLRSIPIKKVQGTSRVFSFCDTDALTELFEEYQPERATLERVHSFPTDGAVGAFSFGDNFGSIKGVLSGLHIPRTLVEPNVWKAAMGVTSDKQECKKRAKLIFPECAKLITRPDIGEAALICLYGILQMGIQPRRDVTPMEG